MKVLALADRFHDISLDGVDVTLPVDLAQEARSGVQGDERGRLRMVKREPMLDRLGGVVLALRQRAAALIADARLLRRMIFQMIIALAGGVGADPPARKALERLLIGDVQIDDVRQLAAKLAKD